MQLICNAARDGISQRVDGLGTGHADGHAAGDFNGHRNGHASEKK